MPNNEICMADVGTALAPRMCMQKKAINPTTGIGLCPHCDVIGEWPTGYKQWLRGMPYPGADQEEEAES